MATPASYRLSSHFAFPGSGTSFLRFMIYSGGDFKTSANHKESCKCFKGNMLRVCVVR